MQYYTDGTDNSEFTIDSAPFETYYFVGCTDDPEMHDEYIKNPTLHPMSRKSFKPDTIVRVQYGYSSNSLWRALVTFRQPSSDSYDATYFLAR